MIYEQYLMALDKLRQVAEKNDFSQAGEIEYQIHLAEVKRLHQLACAESNGTSESEAVTA